MPTVLEIAAEFFPDYSAKQLDDVLWERTGFPGFFDTSNGETPNEIFRRQLQEFKTALETIPRNEMCDWCNNRQDPGKHECAKCRKMLDFTPIDKGD